MTDRLIWIDEDEILALACGLISLPTSAPAFQEKAAALLLKEKFEEYGIEASIEEIGENRANIVASIGEGHPHLLISGHLDVVPARDGWTYGPYEPTVAGGKLYGRGSADMKGGVAALAMALCYLKKSGMLKRGTITFAGTCGEEDDLCGIEAFRERHGFEEIDAVLIGEASSEKLLAAQKGCLWIQFSALGKAAHSGFREQGINAAEKMLDFLTAFRAYEFPVKAHSLLGSPSMNINGLMAGEVFNTLPEICRCKVDVRTIPGSYNRDVIDFARDLIARMTAEAPDFQMVMEVIASDEPVDTDLNAPICRAVRNGAGKVLGREILTEGTYYGTDGYRMVREDGSRPDIVVYGPGDPLQNHQVDEYLEVRTLAETVKIYLEAFDEYLNAGNEKERSGENLK